MGERDGSVVGFSAVDPEGPSWSCCSSSRPRSARARAPRWLADALARAAEAGLGSLLIESDPDAEPFYRAAGAELVGTRVSAATGGELPLLRIST